ncbi:hypothetical protein [Streptomyces sp. NPDC001500]
MSSAGARVLLHDVGQVDAWRAGQPVPPVPETDDGADLLNAREGAYAIGVPVTSWETYRTDPARAAYAVLVRGQHCSPPASRSPWSSGGATVTAWPPARPRQGPGAMLHERKPSGGVLPKRGPSLHIV